MLYAHFGTFDVENYGDLLFPLLLERRLAGTGARVVHVSPRGGSAVWSDCVSTISPDDLARLPRRLSGVIIGGGNILSDQPTTLADYAGGMRPLQAYPSLWIGAAQAARSAACPLVWNGPGVTAQWSSAGAAWLRSILRASSHVAVRDVTSAMRLRGMEAADTATGNVTIQVIPDPATEITRLWSSAELAKARTRALEKLGVRDACRYFVVHIKRRWATDPQAIAAAVDQVRRRLHAQPLFLALGRCHGDQIIATEVAQRLPDSAFPPLMLNQPQSLCEVTSLLAGGACMIGCSLHAAIVASCFGRLAVNVVPAHATTRPKFEDFQPAVAATHLLISAWEELPTVNFTNQLCEAASAGASAPPADAPSCRHNGFQLHWARLQKALQSPPAPGLERLPTDFAPQAYRELAVEQAQRLPLLLDELWEVRQQADAAHRTRHAAACENRHLQAQLRHGQQQLKATETRLSEQTSQVDQLGGWIEQLEFGVQELLKSARWRVGNRCGELYRILRRLPSTPLATDLLADVFARYHRNRGLAGEHGGGQGESLRQSVPRHSFLTGASPIQADIIVCVRNALDDTQRCLRSVLASLGGADAGAVRKVILVDDGSDEPCAKYLESVAANDSRFELIRNERATGYTKAANRGLQASRAEAVVLLNSDTIVSGGWLIGLLECLTSDPRIAGVGPLSNAASWQSVPERFTVPIREGLSDWKVNRLPRGVTVRRLAEAVHQSSEKRFPRVPLLNGFCLALRKPVLDQLGGLDEQAFPQGYGEENDLCFRITQAGYELAVADHVYVYHAKSKSYSHSVRRNLSRSANRILCQRWGRQRMEQATAEMREHPELHRIRKRVMQWYRAGAHSPLEKAVESSPVAPHVSGTPGGVSSAAIATHNNNPSASSPRILFVLPVRGGGGGAHSVVQEALAMRRLGVDAQVSIPRQFTADYRAGYPEVEGEPLFAPYDAPAELRSAAIHKDIIVATIYHSVELVKQLCEQDSRLLPAYYIQDYEPWFFAEGSPQWHEATRSYGALPQMACFAKTRWLVERVSGEHGVSVSRILPGVDERLYYPGADRFSSRSSSRPVRLAAMIRPSTPRRAAARTMRVLQSIAADLEASTGNPAKVEISISVFGCHPEESRRHPLAQDFPHRNLGILLRQEVADLLRRTDVFVDLSDYQAFGRTALEAMACGATALVPKAGGAVEFAVHEQNALVVDTSEETACISALRRVIGDDALRQRLQRKALETGSRYSVRRAAVSELQVLGQAWQKHSEPCEPAAHIPPPHRKRDGVLAPQGS